MSVLTRSENTVFPDPEGPARPTYRMHTKSSITPLCYRMHSCPVARRPNPIQKPKTGPHHNDSFIILREGLNSPNEDVETLQGDSSQFQTDPLQLTTGQNTHFAPPHGVFQITRSSYLVKRELILYGLYGIAGSAIVLLRLLHNFQTVLQETLDNNSTSKPPEITEHIQDIASYTIIKAARSAAERSAESYNRRGGPSTDEQEIKLEHRSNCHEQTTETTSDETHCDKTRGARRGLQNTSPTHTSQMQQLTVLRPFWPPFWSVSGGLPIPMCVRPASGRRCRCYSKKIKGPIRMSCFKKRSIILLMLGNASSCILLR